MKNLLYVLICLCILQTSCNKSSDGSLAPGEPIGQVNKIVVLGASTAAGTGALPIDSAWVNRLRSIVSTYPESIEVTNLANGGYTTFQAMPNGFHQPQRPAVDTARNITKTLTLRPRLVLITFPSNDVANGYSNEEILANYSRISGILDSARISYIIFGSQPRNLSDPTERQRLKTLNTQMKLKFGTRINNYYDQLSTSSNTIKAEYAFGDGIHLNNSGHFLILNTLLQHPVFQQIFSLKR